MGKKVKIGKQRRDKYYRLAKEAGLRSRAVFKLSQLNRKFEFLQSSHVLVDLCAAPGGWLQVSTKYMPTSSLIIGVDLVSIKPMPNVITLQDDITKDSCRQAIKRELKTFLADCVLHDGAPNVGKNWGHDAFMQAQLTLSALKLATDILRKGGWFITKIFRSKDHPALVETFKKLFKKVYVTKPDASRIESAEIYVVCQGYLKPDKVNPELLDTKYVFKDANLEPEKPKLNLFRSDQKQKKKKAEGYAEGDYTQHHRFTIKQFLESDNHLELLADANEIIIDDELIAKHPETTDEIRHCCKDVKVLGRKELRELLNWRKKIRQHLKSLQPKPEKSADENNVPEAEEDEEVVLQREVDLVKSIEKREEKKKRKKEMKEKRKKKQKLDLKMVLPGDQPDEPEEVDLFSLRKLKKLQEQAAEHSNNEDDGFSETSSTSSISLESDEEGDEAEPVPQSSLLIDFNDEEKSATSRTDKWFEKDIFNDLIDEEDEDAEIERVVSISKKSVEKRKHNLNEGEDNEDVLNEKSTFELDGDAKKGEMDDDPGFEIVPADSHSTKNVKLNAEGLALAEMWIHSSKTRRELIELGYNRFTNNDDQLPDWFVADEKRHYHKQLPITKEAVEEYRRRLKEIDARPIKKVAQAKARKRKRAVRKLEKAQKKAETVVDNEDMTERQKSKEVRKIYKQYGPTHKKTEVSYVVAKKSQASKRAHRPAGVSGRFKVVDQRLKKDNRKLKGVRNKNKPKGGKVGKGSKGSKKGFSKGAKKRK